MELLEDISFVPSIISALITGLLTWIGTFLFYRQKRDRLDIENEAKQSEEWRKLYLDSKRDSEDKDAKIDELRKEINRMQQKIVEMERKIQLNTIYRCEDVQCKKRRPPLATTNQPRNEKGRFIKRSQATPANEEEITEDVESDDPIQEQPEEPEPPLQ